MSFEFDLSNLFSESNHKINFEILEYDSTTNQLFDPEKNIYYPLSILNSENQEKREIEYDDTIQYSLIKDIDEEKCENLFCFYFPREILIQEIILPNLNYCLNVIANVDKFFYLVVRYCKFLIWKEKKKTTFLYSTEIFSNIKMDYKRFFDDYFYNLDKNMKKQRKEENLYYPTFLNIKKQTIIFFGKNVEIILPENLKFSFINCIEEEENYKKETLDKLMEEKFFYLAIFLASHWSMEKVLKSSSSITEKRCFYENITIKCFDQKSIITQLVEQDLLKKNKSIKDYIFLIEYFGIFNLLNINSKTKFINEKILKQNKEKIELLNCFCREISHPFLEKRKKEVILRYKKSLNEIPFGKFGINKEIFFFS